SSFGEAPVASPPAAVFAMIRRPRGADMTDTIEHDRSFIDRTFGLTEHGTTVRTEFVAGLTTFLTMAYIVFVNPQILANAGMDKGAVFVATCLAAAISTLIMALY